jgi:tetratricopeptide (TPR) repeat protein
MNSLRVAVVAGALAAVLAPAADPVPTPEAIAAAVRQLGAADYRARERATAWLWAAGPAAEPALRDGLTSADAEVAARCRDLLDKIPYGITPGMPRRFVELITAARAGGAAAWPGVVADLLDLGPRGLDVARKLMDRLATTPDQRAALQHDLDRQGWRVAPALLADGHLDRAEELLERGARAVATEAGDLAPVRHYATFVARRGQLDARIAHWTAQVEQAKAPGEARAGQVILTHLARLRGDFALAQRAADASVRPELREAVLFDQGAWAELADFRPPGATSGAIAAGLRAICHQLAGRPAEAETAIADLKKMPVIRSQQAPPLVFRALMYARRPDDALTVLTNFDGPDGALPLFEILCQQHRYDEAFRLPGRPAGERTALRWQWDAARVRVHHLRGERDKLRAVLAPLAAYDRLEPAEAAPAQELVELLVMLGLADDALPVGAALLNSGAAPADVFGKLFPKAPLAAEAWWRSLRLRRPAESMRDTVARLPALLDRRLAGPEGRAAVAESARVARAQPDAEADRWLQGLGEACQAAGLDEEARTYFEEATRRGGSAAAWLKLGDFHADGKRWADAAAAYERAWRADVRQPLPLWLHGWAKARAGAADGRAAMELAHTLPLANEEARLTFADELAKRSAQDPEPAEAARRERRLILQLGGPDSSRGRNAQGVLSGDPAAFPDRLDAADCTQRFLVRMLRTNAYFKRHQGYLSVLHRLEADRARGLLAKGDVVGAVQAATAAQSILPGDISLATRLVPELARRGLTAEADRVYGAAAPVQDKLCRDWPASAAFHNGRAWLAACCRRDLDDALAHARKATELVPERAGYRETLAEIHFQRGERDAALERIQQCLTMEPKNAYFAKQKQRFEAGDRMAPVPEGEGVTR